MRDSTSGTAITDLVDGFPPALVRTAEGVPGTPHTAAPGDTPRVLGRPGPAPALRPAPLTASGAKPTGLPPRERGVAAGRRSTGTRPDHHRTPAPYAPAAPPSSTAGPAASSSNAAGPAIQPTRGSPATPVGAGVPLASRHQADPLREGGGNGT
ncbi:hypothetical protein [Actinomadura rudentiformis]|uniref:Uncharacterized protein n=1 Tax=Actinomadura rudentiformis TaxID=359158 RepID=A0A6H9YTB1_9ACTN|nr:hypothetical protein [Actinomadura rudentiformis]KAB2345251.1 hypothetical protein F8566_28755 [Actinomadura rudentiformis]